LQTVLRLVDLGKAISDKTFLPTRATLTAISEDWKTITTASRLGNRLRAGTTSTILASSNPWVMLFHAGKLMELGGKRLALTKAGQRR